jgi:uncharacterized membrane protein YgcG
MVTPQISMSSSSSRRSACLSEYRWSTKLLSYVVIFGLLLITWPQSLPAYQAPQDAQSPAPAPAYSQQTPDQLQQLVAPIALYPDSLVAQILAASTFPAQIVEADRWVQNHPDLKGAALAQAVNQMDWDPSVKALTAFPSVLGNMDKNISWTSSLGDAYYNQQQDVMDAIQVMRQKAEQAGNLKSTPQQTVENQGSTIVIQPANPQVVYVPAYDPWAVYGYPISPWPYWYPYPGIWYGGPYLSFGVGFGVGFFAGFGWGWGHWRPDWYHHSIYWGGHRYYSRSATFYNRNNYYRGGGYRGVENNVHRGGAYGHGEAYARGGAYNHGGAYAHGNSFARGGVYNHPGATVRPFNGNDRAARGFGQPHTQTGTRSGAFSGYNHGGQSRGFSARGSRSFGASHGGGHSSGHSGGGHSGGHSGGGHGHR